MLTEEDQLNLIKCSQKGDKSALSRLIEANSGLVWTIARKYYNYYKSRVSSVADIEDFVQEGYVGLICCINNFDISKKSKFSAYASIWIEQKCVFFARRAQTSVKIPDHTFSKIVRKKSLQLLGIDCAYSKNVERAESLLNIGSLNTLLGDSEDELIDIIPSNEKTPEAQFELKAEHDYLQFMIDKYLNEREQYVIKQRTNWDKVLEKAKTLQEIGDDLNVTREWVRQLEGKALKKLKSHITD